MRHIFSARPVAVLSRGMLASSVPSVLVAPSGPPQRRLARPLGAAASAINLAAVATTAHHDLGAAAGAQDKPCRCSLAVASGAQNRWTNATIAAILTLHACPARCGARRRALTAKFRIGAVLALQSGQASIGQPPPMSARHLPTKRPPPAHFLEWPPDRNRPHAAKFMRIQTAVDSRL
jgi:hypothetical protein